MNQVMSVEITTASGNHWVDLIAHGGSWWCVCLDKYHSPTGEPLFGAFRWYGDEVVWQLGVAGPEAVVRKFQDSWGYQNLTTDRGMNRMNDLGPIVSHIKAYG